MVAVDFFQALLFKSVELYSENVLGMADHLVVRLGEVYSHC